MTKAEIIDSVAQLTRQQKNHTAEMAERLFELIAESVQQEGRFMWPGFGVFYLRHTKGRFVRRPDSSGLHLWVPAGTTLSFRAARVQRRKAARP
jgi:nucleoid DNA-binding protein